MTQPTHPLMRFYLRAGAVFIFSLLSFGVYFYFEKSIYVPEELWQERVLKSLSKREMKSESGRVVKNELTASLRLRSPQRFEVIAESPSHKKVIFYGLNISSCTILAHAFLDNPPRPSVISKKVARHYISVEQNGLSLEAKTFDEALRICYDHYQHRNGILIVPPLGFNFVDVE